jgi:pimeloyl-ACP methyl ester carboxylesterase
MRQRRFPPSRSYSVAAEPFRTRTADGVRLAGHRLGEGAVAVVFCHGFLGWHRKPRLVEFQQELGRRFAVFAFDFRGHGESDGTSSFGAMEQLDVDAVVGHARAQGFDRVVTFGGSMGGVAVIRHAGLIGGVDGVVAVSTPAMWDGHDSASVRRLVWLTATRSGRWVLRRLRVRTQPEWNWAESPAEVIDRIAPTPVVIVHGRDDHFFDEEQAWLLYRRAGDPKRLMLASSFGHAEDGYSPAFAGQIAAVIMGLPFRRARASA